MQAVGLDRDAAVARATRRLRLDLERLGADPVELQQMEFEELEQLKRRQLRDLMTAGRGCVR